MSRTPKTLTSEECDKLLDCFLLKLDTHSYRAIEIRNYTMTLLMLDAGLRVGEVVRLLISDIYYGDEPGKNLVIGPRLAEKNCERCVPITPRLNDALSLYLKRPCWPALADNTDYAFISPRTKRHITVRQVQRIIGYMSLRSFGRRVHPHILRHTFATRLMRKCNLRIVQELLGHRNIQSTQIYTHPNSDDLKNAIDSLNERSESLDHSPPCAHPLHQGLPACPDVNATDSLESNS